MSNIIVDFDGTIADSLPVVIKLFYEWSGSQPFSSTEIEAIRNMTLKQALKSLHVPLWRVPTLLVKARKDFGNYIGEVPVFDGMPAVLKQLQASGHKLYVMSSNSPQNIRKFLKLHSIDNYFIGIHGNMGLFGKASAMKAIMKRDKRPNEKWYAIGDETRDIDAAKKAGASSIAVNWGYNGSEILQQHKPDYLISSPAELLKLIK